GLEVTIIIVLRGRRRSAQIKFAVLELVKVGGVRRLARLDKRGAGEIVDRVQALTRRHYHEVNVFPTLTADVAANDLRHLLLYSLDDHVVDRFELLTHKLPSSSDGASAKGFLRRSNSQSRSPSCSRAGVPPPASGGKTRWTKRLAWSLPSLPAARGCGDQRFGHARPVVFG